MVLSSTDCSKDGCQFLLLTVSGTSRVDVADRRAPRNGWAIKWEDWTGLGMAAVQFAARALGAPGSGRRSNVLKLDGG